MLHRNNIADLRMLCHSPKGVCSRLINQFSYIHINDLRIICIKHKKTSIRTKFIIHLGNRYITNAMKNEITTTQIHR